MSESKKIIWDFQPKLRCVKCGVPVDKPYYVSDDNDENPQVVCEKCFMKASQLSIRDKREKREREVRQQHGNASYPSMGEVGEKGEKEEREEFSENFWYPTFRLRRNPFVSFNYKFEQVYGFAEYIEYVDTPASQLIHNLAVSGISAFIVGERGCGKTTALDLASQGLKNYFLITEPRAMLDIFNEIWNLNIDIDNEYFYSLFEKVLHRWFSNQRCTGCKRKCSLPQLRDIRYGVFWLLSDIKVSCLIKEWTFDEIIKWGRFPKNPVFLIDCPDDILEVGVYEFSKLIAKILDEIGGTIIITATPEQYQLCLKSDTLARFPKYDFPLPTREQLKQIIIKRIRGFQGWDESAPIPFTDEAIDYLIEVSRYNIRKLLFNCQRVLQKMWENQMDTPCGLKFVKELITREEGGLTVEQMIMEILREFKKQGKTWIGVDEVRKALKNKYNLEVSSKRLGRLLSGLLRRGILIDRREYYGLIQYHL
jgi:hypothetical protein